MGSGLYHASPATYLILGTQGVRGCSSSRRQHHSKVPSYCQYSSCLNPHRRLCSQLKQDKDSIISPLPKPQSQAVPIGLQTVTLLNTWARVHSCPGACNYANTITMGDVQGLSLRLLHVPQLFPDWLERWEKRALWSSGLYISAPVLCLSSALYGNSTFPNSGTENLLSTVSAWSDLILSRYDSRVELSKRGKFANRVSLLSARTESWWYTGIRRGWDVNPTYTFNVSEIFYVLLMVQNSPEF